MLDAWIGGGDLTISHEPVVCRLPTFCICKIYVIVQQCIDWQGEFSPILSSVFTLSL